MKFMLANRIAPDGTARFAESHHGYSVCPKDRIPHVTKETLQAICYGDFRQKHCQIIILKGQITGVRSWDF